MRSRSAYLFLAALTTAVLAAPVLPPPTPARAAEGGHLPDSARRDCPDVVDADGLAAAIDAAEAAGTPLTGEGLTVSRGYEPELFDVEFLRVRKDGLAPGRDLIIAQVSSTATGASEAIETAGVWAGMSGSPVYHQGRIVGAIAYGFTSGPSDIAGLTPAADMMAVLGSGGGTLTTQSVTAPEEVELSRADRSAIGQASELEAASVQPRMRQLQVPISVSGLSRRLDTVSEHLRGTGLPFWPFAGSGVSAASPAATTAERASIKAGGNYAAAISHGDVTFAGTGTTTMVCDGKALAFGHPFFWRGKQRLSAHAARADVIVTDPAFGSYKDATTGGVVGRVSQDRLAAISGPLGKTFEPIEITSYLRAYNDRGVRTGTDRGATSVLSKKWTAILSVYHLWANGDTLLDQIGGGSARLTWTVDGTFRGAPFTLQRTNRYQNGRDITGAAAWEPYSNVSRLARIRGVRLDRYHLRANLHTRRRYVRIAGLQVHRDGKYRSLRSMTVRPGRVLRLRVRLIDERLNTTYRRFRYEVPQRRRLGFGRVTVSNGSSDLWRRPRTGCVFEGCASPDEAKVAFAKLVTSMARAGRNDDLRLTARVHFEGRRKADKVAKNRRQHRVVRGRDSLDLTIVPRGLPTGGEF